MKTWVVNPGLPKKAGAAQLEYFEPGPHDSGEKLWPRRDKAMITLPIGSRVEVAPLGLGLQFLYRTQYRSPGAYGDETAIFFGGTDEQPFLVRLQPEAWNTFRNEGEQAFYEALVPTEVKCLCRVFATDYVRQGDIFSVPLPFDWERLQQLQACVTEEEVVIEEVKAGALFRTRHLLTGAHLIVDFLHGRKLVAEGWVDAPDHAVLRLNQVSFLTQTSFLYDPPSAD